MELKRSRTEGRINMRTIKRMFFVFSALALSAVSAFAAGSPPPSIGTTLAFDQGEVVTVQYSQNYFCNSPGPATSPTFSPCIIGADAVVDPVPDAASNKLNVIVPVFLGTSEVGGIFDPTLGANNFTQCPDTTNTLKCINHPAFTSDIFGTVSPVPIHSHIISGNGPKGRQGGWWELKVWAVQDPGIWPDPKTGACTAGTGCLTSEEALAAASANGSVKGPVVTNIYLFFNVVGSHAK
jgi:hypothetical protein